MKNKIKAKESIEYIVIDNYINANSRPTLNLLKNKVKNHLKNIKDNLVNESTGYKARINNKSIGKMIFPAPYFNPFSKEYVANLNALLQVKELFQKAIYIDTLKMMKDKDKKEKFHHFVAPLIMNKQRYRVLITACQKENSSYLYILNTSVFLEEMPFLGKTIRVQDLVNNIKLYNYKEQDYEYYDVERMRKENIIKEQKPKYSGC